MGQHGIFRDHSVTLFPPWLEQKPIVERWEREYDEKVPVLKTGMQDIAMNEKDFIVVKTGMQDIAMNEKDSIHVYFNQVCSGEDRHAGHRDEREGLLRGEDWHAGERDEGRGAYSEIASSFDIAVLCLCGICSF